MWLLRLIEVGLQIESRSDTTHTHQQEISNEKKSHHQKPKKKQAAQIHALIKRTYIFQKVGISVLNRINSDILQFIFIIRMSLLCVCV